MVDFDNLPDDDTVKTSANLDDLDKIAKEAEEAEAKRKKKLVERLKGNKNSSKENRLAKSLERTVSVYAGDISNKSKRKKYLQFLDKVKAKELTLDEPEAILNLMISEQFRKSDKTRDNKLIIEAIAQLKQIAETKRRLEESATAIMRDRSIMDLFEQWARILSIHIKDPQLLASVLFDMRRELNQTIDITNLNKRIDSETKKLTDGS